MDHSVKTHFEIICGNGPLDPRISVWTRIAGRHVTEGLAPVRVHVLQLARVGSVARLGPEKERGRP